MNTVDIQFQDVSGTWVTVASTFNQDQHIATRLDEVQRSYNNARVRAIDSRSGSVIDIR